MCACNSDHGQSMTAALEENRQEDKEKSKGNCNVLEYTFTYLLPICVYIRAFIRFNGFCSIKSKLLELSSPSDSKRYIKYNFLPDVFIIQLLR